MIKYSELHHAVYGRILDRLKIQMFYISLDMDQYHKIWKASYRTILHDIEYSYFSFGFFLFFHIDS